MITPKITIPFFRNLDKSSFTLSVISNDDFLHRTSSAISSSSQAVLSRASNCSERACFKISDKRASLLILPKRFYYKEASNSLNRGELFLVQRSGFLFVGFIPEIDQQDLAVRKVYYENIENFHNHRLDSLEGTLEKCVFSYIGSSMFGFTRDMKLNIDNEGQCSLMGVSIILLSDHRKEQCALLCCRGSDVIPPVIPFPTFCSVEYPELEHADLSSIKEVSFPFIMGRAMGNIKLPFCKIDKLLNEIMKRKLRTYSYSVNPHDLDLICPPKGCLFSPKTGPSGGQLIIVQSAEDRLELVFVPDANLSRYRDRFTWPLHKSLLQQYEETLYKYNFSEKRLNRISLHMGSKIVLSEDKQRAFLSGTTLVFLASNVFDNYLILCKKNNFELKNFDPTETGEPIYHPLPEWKEVLTELEAVAADPEVLGEPLEKRTRTEDTSQQEQDSEEPETSARAAAEALCFFSYEAFKKAEQR